MIEEKPHPTNNAPIVREAGGSSAASAAAAAADADAAAAAVDVFVVSMKAKYPSRRVNSRGHDPFAIKTRYEVRNGRYFASIFCELPRGAPEHNGNTE